MQHLIARINILFGVLLLQSVLMLSDAFLGEVCLVVHRLGVQRVDLVNWLIQMVFCAAEESAKRVAVRKVHFTLSRSNLRVQLFNKFCVFLIDTLLRSHAVLQVRTCVGIHFALPTKNIQKIKRWSHVYLLIRFIMDAHLLPDWKMAVHSNVGWERRLFHLFLLLEGRV